MAAQFKDRLAGLLALATFMSMALGALAADPAVLRAGTFEDYKTSMGDIAAAEGDAIAQKAAIALMTLAWQSDAPDVSMADWTKSMALSSDAWLAAIRPFEGLSAAELIAAREALPAFDLWP
jgi:hypothetical protein